MALLFAYLLSNRQAAAHVSINATCFVLMKSILLLFILLSSASVADAQNLPVPGAKHPDWVLRELPAERGMPTLHVYAAPQPGRLATVDVRNAETGAVERVSDPAHALVYDFIKSVIEDRRTGKRYTFYRKGTAPKVSRPETAFL